MRRVTIATSTASLDDALASPEFLADPYPIFTRFRAESPVHWVEPWNCWLVTRGADIDATIRDTRRFKSSDRVTRVIESTPGFSHDRLGALHENFRVGMAQTDPPDHTRVRGLVSAAFTPRRIESLRTRIQELVNGVSLGSTYALLALGLAMVFSILGLINFAHGELVTIGGYTMWTLFNHGFPWPAVLLLTLIATTLAAVAMERIAFRPLRGANIATLLIPLSFLKTCRTSM